MTQKEAILDYIKEKGSITPNKAFSELGITKLSTRVSEMKKTELPLNTKELIVKPVTAKPLII